MMLTMHTKDKAIEDTKPERSTPILVVAKSDRWRRNLKILLETEPWIKVIGQTDDKDSALEMIFQHHPALLILDMNMPYNGTWKTTLKQVKAEWPQTRCLILGDTTQKLQAARAAGADVVLMKGFAIAELFATIEELLFGKNDSENSNTP